MKMILEFLNYLPPLAQVSVIGLILGAGLVYAHETRYMTVGQYTKSYVLNLKAEIRAIRAELDTEELDPVTRELLEEQLESLLDELCYERPDDVYCKRREE